MLRMIIIIRRKRRCLTKPIGSMENINGPYPQKYVIQYISYANSCKHNCAFFFASITMHMCINVPTVFLLVCVARRCHVDVNGCEYVFRGTLSTSVLL